MTNDTFSKFCMMWCYEIVIYLNLCNGVPMFIMMSSWLNDISFNYSFLNNMKYNILLLVLRTYVSYILHTRIAGDLVSIKH